MQEEITYIESKKRSFLSGLSEDIWAVFIGGLPLIGTTDEQRIRNIAEAFKINLDRQDWYELYAVSRGDL